MLKQVESQSESPENILRALEIQMAANRRKRETLQSRRVAVLAGGLLLIVGGTTVALCALFSSLNGLSHGHPANPEAAAPVVSQR